MSWHDPDKEDTTIYKVVVNHEEQYSIWPADRKSPLGWTDVDKNSTKAECLAYIKEVWTDMRPLSLRKKMSEAEQRRAQSQATEQNALEQRSNLNEDNAQDNLVNRLSTGSHRVEASTRPKWSHQALRKGIEQGYVHIKFIDTEGGTELGMRLDRDSSRLDQADLEEQSGLVHLEGSLTLNYVKVRCIADIDLKTLTGQGHLIRLEA